MTAHKVADLTGALLDAAVAKAENFPQWSIHTYEGESTPVVILGPAAMDRFEWNPSEAWEQGGPIIEREQIELTWDSDTGVCSAAIYLPLTGRFGGQGEGPTPLIAAMRAYVASKLGDTVELP